MEGCPKSLLLIIHSQRLPRLPSESNFHKSMANTSRIDAEVTSVAETLIKFCNALNPDEQIDYLDALAKAASGILLKERADKVEGNGDGLEYDARAVEEEATELLEATQEAERWIAEASRGGRAKIPLAPRCRTHRTLTYLHSPRRLYTPTGITSLKKNKFMTSLTRYSQIPISSRLPIPLGYPGV
jgi:hypothetical protein